MRISDMAFDLIVSEEVTSKASYEAKLRHTEWPQGASGVTVGIGYDLGQTESAKIRDDWGGRVLEAMLSSVLSASGVTGNAADSLATRLKADTDIPWNVALAVHRECAVPRLERGVEKALLNRDKALSRLLRRTRFAHIQSRRVFQQRRRSLSRDARYQGAYGRRDVRQDTCRDSLDEAIMAGLEAHRSAPSPQCCDKAASQIPALQLVNFGEANNGRAYVRELACRVPAAVE
jgi:hypothetical protein